MLLFSQSVFHSCTDDSIGDNFYTFTGKTIADYLEDNNDKYSDFIYVLKESGIWSLLSTYGNMTCFAPTNDAFQQFLNDRNTSLEMLSKNDCDTIAYTHLIKDAAFFTTDVIEGTLPNQNMLERNLTLSCDSDIINNNNLLYYINKNALMVHFDDSVENGVVHTINQVLKSSTSFLPDLLSENPDISIFFDALVKTGMADSIKYYLDNNYSVSEDSTSGFNIRYDSGDRIVWGNYPTQRKFMYTAFVVPDYILINKYDIKNWEELKDYADYVYGPGAADLTNGSNSLNKLISYHLLDRYASYSSINCSQADILTCFITTNAPDIVHDFYETLMPYSIMKVSSPPGSDKFINRKYKGRKLEVEGIRLFTPSEMSNVEQEAVNGIYHYISDLMLYDENTINSVFLTRFRFDATTLTPDFMNSGARGWQPATIGDKDMLSMVFKHGFVKNFKYDNNTLFSCRPRYFWFNSYMGDNCTVYGSFDIKFKLPPVPPGTYEVRLGYSAMPCRGVIQVYFDNGSGDVPCDIPIDMRGTPGELTGFEPDVPGDDEYNSMIDKSMHNRGFLKGPASYQQGATNLFRDNSLIVRRILVTENIQPGKDYYLRFRQVLDNPTSELSFDYIELCPKDIYGSPEGEDIY